MYLKSKMFGRAYDVCSTISNEMIGYKEGVDDFVSKVHVRVTRSIKDAVYQDFNDLLSIKLKSKESYHKYEPKFTAKIEKIHHHGITLAINQSILAMMLLSESNIDEVKQIQILSSATSGSVVTSSDNDDAIVTQITYENVASVLPQCDNNSRYWSKAYWK